MLYMYQVAIQDGPTVMLIMEYTPDGAAYRALGLHPEYKERSEITVYHLFNTDTMEEVPSPGIWGRKTATYFRTNKGKLIRRR